MCRGLQSYTQIVFCMLLDAFNMGVGKFTVADESAGIRMNIRVTVRESIVMLSATKHLGPASEILRGVYTEWNECAQDDKRRRLIHIGPMNRRWAR